APGRRGAGAAAPRQPAARCPVARPCGAGRPRGAGAPPLRRAVAARGGTAGARSGLRPRDPPRPHPVAVLVVVVRSAVPAAAHVPLTPFALEFIPRVQPGPQLPGLVRAATPHRAAGVAPAAAVEP